MGLKQLGDQILAWVAIALFVAFASPFFILAWQSLHWLKFGVWEPWSVWRGVGYLGWSPPEMEWIGAKKVLWWLLDLPLSLAIPLLAMALVFGAGSLMQAFKK
nr:hypothetical protein [Brevundimonas diminuta]